MESIAILQRCSEDIAINVCVAKAKYHIKKGPTPRYELLKLSTCPFEKAINLFLYCTIDSPDYSLTDTHFTLKHSGL